MQMIDYQWGAPQSPFTTQWGQANPYQQTQGPINPLANLIQPMGAGGGGSLQPQAPQAPQPSGLAGLVNSAYQGPSMRSMWNHYMPQTFGSYRLGG